MRLAVVIGLSLAVLVTGCRAKTVPKQPLSVARLKTGMTEAAVTEDLGQPDSVWPKNLPTLRPASETCRQRAFARLLIYYDEPRDALVVYVNERGLVECFERNPAMGRSIAK